MKLRIPKGYTPSTYDQLAELAGLPVSEARRCADEMAAAGIISLIKHGDVIFYKFDLREGRAS